MKLTPAQSAEWLAARLESLGMTQEQLGAAAGLAGADISRYKQHKQRPSVDTLAKLAHALNCNIVEILIGFGSIDPDDETTPRLITGKKNSKVIWE